MSQKIEIAQKSKLPKNRNCLKIEIAQKMNFPKKTDFLKKSKLATIQNISWYLDFFCSGSFLFNLSQISDEKNSAKKFRKKLSF